MAPSLDDAAVAASAPALFANGELRLRLCRHGHMIYSLNDLYIGRSLDVYGEYAEDEAELYLTLLEPGQLAVDAGANIGTHTLVMAQAVRPNGLVVAFEPQRLLFQILCANLALNRLHNVMTHCAGLGAEQTRMRVEPIDYDKAGNFGRATLSDEGPGEAIMVATLDSLSLPRCNLIKADVEGMELAVLQGARETIERHRPILYVENNRKTRSAALIGLMLDLDYRPFWHCPRLFRTPNFRSHDEDIFGKTININMLCLPPGDGREVRFRPITAPEDWWQDRAERE